MTAGHVRSHHKEEGRGHIIGSRKTYNAVEKKEKEKRKEKKVQKRKSPKRKGKGKE